MKLIGKFTVVIFICLNISSCVAAAIGVGAAGGYVLGDHYKIEKTKEW